MMAVIHWRLESSFIECFNESCLESFIKSAYVDCLIFSLQSMNCDYHPTLFHQIKALGLIE